MRVVLGHVSPASTRSDAAVHANESVDSSDTPVGAEAWGRERTALDRRSHEREKNSMPMIDVYATSGTFADPKALARNLAATLMKIEQVPDVPMFRQNTAAFVHDLPHLALSNVQGDSNYVRVQVLTNAGALDREKQLAVVRQFTDLVAVAAGDASLSGRTWVLLTEAVDGGWGLAGHANTNAELVAAARAQIAELQQPKPATG